MIFFSIFNTNIKRNFISIFLTSHISVVQNFISYLWTSISLVQVFASGPLLPRIPAECSHVSRENGWFSERFQEGIGIW